MAVIPGVDLEPTDQDGNLKTAEDCFLEAYRIVSSLSHSEEALETEIHKEAEISTGGWNDINTIPSWYVSTLVKAYDKEWLEWEPETLWQTIGRKFKVALNTVAKNKINAVKNLLLTDAFWDDWVVFENTVGAFNDHIPNFFSVEPPSPAEMAWAVSEARYIRPGEEFSEEASGYVRIICEEAGLVYFPEALGFAQNDPLSRLAADVRSAWNMIKDNRDVKIIENEMGVNLVRLQTVEIYLKDREDRRE